MNIVELKPGVRHEVLDPDTTLIRINEVMAKTGLARSTIYKKVKDDPSFPRPIKMDKDANRSATVCFVLGEIQTWVRRQIALRNQENEDGDQQ